MDFEWEWRVCPGCNERKIYNADTWSNYDLSPKSRLVYVCAECAPPEGKHYQQKVKDYVEG